MFCKCRGVLPWHQRDFRECHLSVMTVRAVGVGFDQERHTARQRHGFKSGLVSPDARWLKNVSGLIKLGQIDLPSASVNWFLAAHQLSCVVVVNGHFQACRGVAMEVNCGEMKVFSSGCQHSPNLPLAFLHGRSWWALWNIVFRVTACCSYPPTLPRDCSNMMPWDVVLKVNAVLLVIRQRLALPSLDAFIALLSRIQQRPHVLTHLKPADVGSDITCGVPLGENALTGLRLAEVGEPKLFTRGEILDGALR